MTLRGINGLLKSRLQLNYPKQMYFIFNAISDRVLQLNYFERLDDAHLISLYGVIKQILSMIVMKFGGTSVGTADSILNACRLVKERIDKRPLVVVSAHNSEKYRMTNTLIESAESALRKKPDSSKIRELQNGICEDLNISSELVSDLLDEIDVVLKGINLIGEISPRTMDRVMSYGERMSARVLAETLKIHMGVNAIWKPSYELGFRTDDNFSMACPDESCYADIAAKVAGIDADVIVTTGFLGMSPDGQITTLGRGGSDLSATFFGAAVKADEIEIWTDVDGVMTADPNVVPSAKSVPELSFIEAAELAWYGAKVLYPLSMLPAIESGIPVRVLNTNKPEHPGTRIVNELQEHHQIAKSIAYKKNITLITITTPKMLGMYGFLADAFAVFAKYQLDIHMIATAEISFSLTIPGDITDEIRQAAEEIYEFADVKIEPDNAVICIVGENMAHSIGTASRVLSAVSRANVGVKMISQEAHNYNISLLVDESKTEDAVRALHKEFFTY